MQGAQARVQVGGVTLDPRDGRAVVILVDGPGRVFPLWVSDEDASAIAGAMHASSPISPISPISPMSPVSPMSPDAHGLLAAAVCALGATVDHVKISGVVVGIVTATVALCDADGMIELPARASDAIALALRLGAPVFIHEELLAQVAARVADAEARSGSRSSAGAEPLLMSQAERWNQLLAHLSSSRSPEA